MSGYGSPDDHAEHALIMAENGIHHSSTLIQGPVRERCVDCGDTIPPARVEFLTRKGMRCEYCVQCQSAHDTAPRVRMV